MIATAVIVWSVALVALAAVAAAGLGPVQSLRRTVVGLRDLADEAGRLRRNLDVLQHRRRRLVIGPGGRFGLAEPRDEDA